VTATGREVVGETLANHDAMAKEILRRYHTEGPQTNETGLSATIRIALDVFTQALAAQAQTDEAGLRAAVEDTLDIYDADTYDWHVHSRHRQLVTDLRAALTAADQPL
jgi:hypothetical protein